VQWPTERLSILARPALEEQVSARLGAVEPWLTLRVPAVLLRRRLPMAGQPSPRDARDLPTQELWRPQALRVVARQWQE
jgi:hypothetical protein